MKPIDKKGRLFGKINVLDFIVIVLVIGLIILASRNIFDKEESNISTKDEMFDLEIETIIIMDKGYFDLIKVGNRLTESQDYLDGRVKDIKILPVEIVKEDLYGNIIKGEDPALEKAIVTIEGKASYSNHTYEFGKQEIRQGRKIFIESDLYRYRVEILDFKVVS